MQNNQINEDGTNPFLRTIEELNAQYIALTESEEYIEGQKLLNWKRIIKNGQVLTKIGDFFRHRKALSP